MPEIHKRAAFVVFFGFLTIFRGQLFLFPTADFLAVAVMRLVVHNHDIFHGEQFFAGPLQHFAFGLFGDQLLVAPSR
jgi:hypothetical protein